MSNQKPQEIEFQSEDYLDGATPISPESIDTLYYLENGMVVTGVKPKAGLKKTKGGFGFRLLYPLQLQHVRLPQGDRVIFTPILGCEGLLNVRNHGVTGDTPIGDGYKTSYIRSATIEYLLKREAVDRLAAEARQRHEEERQREIEAIEAEQKRMAAAEAAAQQHEHGEYCDHDHVHDHSAPPANEDQANGEQPQDDNEELALQP